MVVAVKPVGPIGCEVVSIQIDIHPGRAPCLRRVAKYDDFTILFCIVRSILFQRPLSFRIARILEISNATDAASSEGFSFDQKAKAKILCPLFVNVSGSNGKLL